MQTHRKRAGNEGLEGILRNTLRVLCSNAVSYGSTISIDALIGITVDSSEVILVNLHELLDRSGCSYHAAGEQSTFNGGHGHPMQKRIKSEPHADGSIHQPGNSAVGIPDLLEFPESSYAADGATEYDESFADVVDVNDYEEGEGEEYYDNSGMDAEQNTDGFDDNEFPDAYLTEFDANPQWPGADIADDMKPFKMPELPFVEYSPQPSRPTGHKTTHRSQVSAGRKKSTANLAPKRQSKVTVKAEANYGGCVASGNVPPQTSGVQANEKTTVYTCSVCGKMIRHLTTFQRHKQKHEGVVFRCDLCGAVLSRRDVLSAHRRKCEAKLLLPQQ